MLSLLSEENPWKNKLDILFKYTMRMLFYLLQLFVYIAIRALRTIKLCNDDPIFTNQMRFIKYKI